MIPLIVANLGGVEPKYLDLQASLLAITHSGRKVREEDAQGVPHALTAEWIRPLSSVDVPSTETWKEGVFCIVTRWVQDTGEVEYETSGMCR